MLNFGIISRLIRKLLLVKPNMFSKNYFSKRFDIGQWLAKLGPERAAADLEFRPAALDLVERPPSPVGRSVIWTLMIFFVLLILWACLSKVDVVAVAMGEIVPKGKVKVIQAVEMGIVRGLHVEEGIHVNKGQLLVELDSTMSEADIMRLSIELTNARCELTKASALLAWDMKNLKTIKVPLPDGVSSDEAEMLELSVRQEAIGMFANLAGLNNEVQKRRASMEATQNNVNKLGQVLPIITKRAEVRKKLYDQKVGSETEWLVLKQRKIEIFEDLQGEKQRYLEDRAAVNVIHQRYNQTVSNFRSDQLQKKIAAQRQIKTLSQELIKAEQQDHFQQIEAPVSGKVQQLSVHTIGGVVSAAQPLMVIVPDDLDFVVEAMIENKDVGFIREGQPAEIKLETFPFTEYGLIHGEVLHLSRDAVTLDEKHNVYIATVSLKRNYVQVEDRKIPLSSGMSATVEVKIRKRRLISYFLSPLLKYSSESLRER